MRIEYHADPTLHPYVECLWWVERAFASPADTFILLPDRHVELVFSAGALFTVDPVAQASAAAPSPAGVAPPTEAGPAVAGRVLPRAYVVGLLDRPVRLRARGTVRAVAARCPAWSVASLLSALLATPDSDSCDALGSIRPLHTACEPLAGRIAACLDAGDAAGALAHLDGALRGLVAAAPAIPGRVRRAGRVLGEPWSDPWDAARDGDRGAPRLGAPVRRAAAAGGWTPRHLERQFRALTGVTPKGYARRARFELARDRLWADPHTRLSALAAECGYADQAHLTREFAAFAGAPPARWAAGVARTRALLHPPAPDGTPVPR